MVELLKQPQYQPFSVQEEIVSIFAGTNGYLDDVAPSDVQDFEAGLLQFMHDRHEDILDEIVSTGALSDELTERLVAAITEFKDQRG